MSEKAIEMVQKLDAEVAAASRWAFGLLIGFLGTAATVAANGKEIVPGDAPFDDKLPVLAIFVLSTALYDYYVLSVRNQASRLIEIGLNAAAPPVSGSPPKYALSRNEHDAMLVFLRQKLNRDTWFRIGAFTSLMILASITIIEPF